MFKRTWDAFDKMFEEFSKDMKEFWKSDKRSYIRKYSYWDKLLSIECEDGNIEIKGMYRSLKINGKLVKLK